MAKQPAPPRKNRSPTDRPAPRAGKSAKSAVLSEIERLCANHAALSGSGATQRPPAKEPPPIAPTVRDDWASEDDRQPGPEPDQEQRDDDVMLPMYLFLRMVVAIRKVAPDFLASTPGTPAVTGDPEELPENLRGMPIALGRELFVTMVKACQAFALHLLDEIDPQTLAAAGIDYAPPKPEPVAEPTETGQQGRDGDVMLPMNLFLFMVFAIRQHLPDFLASEPGVPASAKLEDVPVEQRGRPVALGRELFVTMVEACRIMAPHLLDEIDPKILAAAGIDYTPPESEPQPPPVNVNYGWDNGNGTEWSSDDEESNGDRLIPPPFVEPKTQQVAPMRRSAVGPAFTPARSAFPWSRPTVQQQFVRVVTGWVAPLGLALALFGFAFGFGLEQNLFLSAGYWIGFTAATELTYRIIAGLMFVGVVLYFLIRMTSSESIGGASAKAMGGLFALVLIVGLPVGALFALFGVAWGFDTELTALSWTISFVQERLFYKILSITVVVFIVLAICNAIAERLQSNPAPQPHPYGGYAINDFVETNAFGDAQLGNYDAAAQGLSDQYRNQFAPKFRE